MLTEENFIFTVITLMIAVAIILFVFFWTLMNNNFFGPDIPPGAKKVFKMYTLSEDGKAINIKIRDKEDIANYNNWRVRDDNY